MSGALVVNGSSSSPAVFTSLLDDSVGGDTNGDGTASSPVAGDWGGISGSSASLSIDHADVRYGQTGISGGSLTTTSVTNSTVEYASYSGISVDSSVAITVSGNTVTGVGSSGIQVSQDGTVSNAAASTTTVINNTVNGVSGGAGIIVQADPYNNSGTAALANVPAPTVTGNNVTGVSTPFAHTSGSQDQGAGFAIAISATNLLPAQLTGNTGSSNTVNALELGGTLRGNLILPVAGLPIVVGLVDVPIYGFTSGLAVGSGVTLTANAGAVLKFNPNYDAYWNSPAGLSVSGALVVNGSSSSPAVFTSLLDDSVGGDTNGDGTASSPVAGDWGGISVADGATASLVNTDIRYASTALSVADDGAAEFHGSVVTSAFGVSAGDGYVDATGVDWGDSYGPSPIGSGVAYSGGAANVVPWVGYVAPAPLPGVPYVPPAANPCAQIYFVAVRGSGEDPQGDPPIYGGDESSDGLGSRVRDVLTGMTDELAQYSPSTTVKTYGLQYRALGVLSDPLLRGTQAYFTSIYEGVDQLTELMSDETRMCPTEKIVLSGYSQGALVIHIALRDLASSGSPSISATHLAAVALIADPAKVANGGEYTLEEFDKEAGSGIAKAEGIWTKFPLDSDVGPLPPSVTGRTIAMCRNHDPVCAPPSPQFLLEGLLAYVHIHTDGYYQTESAVLGRWAADKFLARAFVLAD
ncbi:parallel beta helix pectate lyase-like protein [Jatrophihabitans sp. GAS493]|nr:parallel beta helix pectate lyase-like protein [Jatrophihabitans sp. GAS493]